MLKPRKRPAKRVSSARKPAVPKTDKIEEVVSQPPKAGKKISQDKLFGLIRDKAYELYMARGGVAGRDLNDWYKAEALVKKELGL